LFTVLDSVGGADLGGPFGCPTKLWTTPSYPRHLFHRADNKRGNLPQHTKQIVALREPRRAGDTHEGWILLGSHNFTTGAWGKLQFPKGSCLPQSEPPPDSKFWIASPVV